MIRRLRIWWMEWRAERALERWMREALKDRECKGEEYPPGSGPFGF